MRDWEKIEERVESIPPGRKWLVMLLSGGALLAGSFLAGGAWERSGPPSAPEVKKSEIQVLKDSLAQLPLESESTLGMSKPIDPPIVVESPKNKTVFEPVGAPSPVIRMAPPTPVPPRRDAASLQGLSGRNSVDMALERRRGTADSVMERSGKRDLASLPLISTVPSNPSPALDVKQALYIPKPTPAAGPSTLQSMEKPKPKKLLQRGMRTKNTTDPAQYTLQVRAFRELKDAMALGETLNREGYKSYVVKSEIEGKGLWYRVRIGEFPSLKEATEFQTVFEASESLSTFVSPL